jgi:hypothetical protein
VFDGMSVLLLDRGEVGRWPARLLVCRHAILVCGVRVTAVGKQPCRVQAIIVPGRNWQHAQALLPTS